MTTGNKLIDRRNELDKEIKLLETELKIANKLTNEVMKLQAIIDTTTEEPEWATDFEKLDRYTKLGYSLIDIEIAKKWHAAYRKAQNSNLLRKQENEQLRAENLELQTELRKSDELVFQEAIDCMNTAETGYGYIIANEEKFSAAIQRLEHLKKIVENKRSEKQWQITEERMAAIKELSELLTAIGCTSCRYFIKINYGEEITVLKEMLKEAGKE